ncbi:MAG: DNA-binding protein [Actinobacteria bacterium]|nr:DNA-binding protein [Actinomycetota bacterium]
MIPEIDHLLGQRLGARSRATFYAGIVEGHYLVADLPRDGYARVAELNRRFESLVLGFVDAAVVVVAESLRLRRVATTDRRHFDVLASALDLEILP